jgi:hypothetical protein
MVPPLLNPLLVLLLPVWRPAVDAPEVEDEVAVPVFVAVSPPAVDV